MLKAAPKGLCPSDAEVFLEGHEPRPPTLADFLSLAHWTDRPLPPPEPLLGEVITNTTRMFIGGPTGKGKSQFALACSTALAGGADFLHWRVSRPCNVLYLDGEMASDLIQERARDAVRRSGVSPSSLFIVSSDDAETLAARFPKLPPSAPVNTEAGHAFVLALLDEFGKLGLKIDVVVFDNRMSLSVGDMKEEQPWTDTQPLVMEITRRRIAQIWIDHTGHDEGKIYGTKTKEWKFDTVALLCDPPNPPEGADVCFTLKFTKARRRSPRNRRDFEPGTMMLADDEWTVEGAERPAKNAAGLTSNERGWLKDITDLFAEPNLAVRRRIPGPKADLETTCLTLTQEQLRAGLVRKERLTLGKDGTVPNNERTKLSTRLNALKDKGKLGRGGGLVWLI